MVFRGMGFERVDCIGEHSHTIASVAMLTGNQPIVES